MTAVWKRTALGSLGRIVTGKTPSSERPEDFGDVYPFITPSDISGTAKKTVTERFLSEQGAAGLKGSLLPDRAVCVVCIGATIGKVTMTDRPSFSNQQINSIIPHSGQHDPDFVYYLCRLLPATLVSFAGGAATPIINKTTFSSIEVPVPEYKIQRKIAAVLSAYDDLIANNQRRIALLESMAEEIYREWFVRMRFPGADQTEFSKGIPCNWRYQRLNEVCSIVKGKSYAAEDLSDDDTAMPFVTLKSFNRGGGYRGAGLKFYKGEFKDDQLVRQGDIVMAVTDMTQDRVVVGQAARIPDLGERGAVISLDVMKLVPKTVDGTFLYLYLRFSGFSNYIKEFANGANVLHLKPDLVGKQSVALPAMDLQLTLSKLAEPLLQEAEQLTQVSEKLEAMRDALLPRLISGKLRVDQLDIQCPPSMRAETAEAAP